MVIVSGKPDIARAQSHPDHRGRPSRSHQSHADQLLDLDPGSRGGGSSSDGGGGGERGGASSSAASTTSSQAQVSILRARLRSMSDSLFANICKKGVGLFITRL